MSQGLVERQYLEDIGDAIRSKVGGSSTYTPSQMASAIAGIHTADEVVLVQKTVNANGQYNASDDSADGYSGVMVNVPNTYGSGDEGKVVSDGALVSQTGMSVVSNGTYDTTLFSQVSVAIPKAVLMSKVISENGTYDALDDNADGFSRVTVNVAGGGGGLDKALLETELSEITDNTLSALRSYAFYNQRSLENIIFNNVINIGSSAFQNCTALKSITFPKCEYVQKYAFNYCSMINSISMLSVKGVYDYAFAACSSLTYFSFPLCSFVGTYAFVSCSRLISCELNDCETIGSYAFSSCRSLLSIVASNCKNIGMSAFASCASLPSALFPQVSVLWSNAFANCVRMSHIEIDKCEVIHSYVFWNCYSLESLYLPNIKSIYNNAFGQCSKLESVYLLSTDVCRLYGNAFSNTPITNSTYLGHYGSIYVLQDLVELYKVASIWSLYSDRIIAYTE